ncbi:MAG TPA: hypothetical protein G4O01_02905 [Dehalococcoidia bacterium]|jgi:hypothetical protein|nr:hypothetical protein [Dehalococcoidia bacterium]
MSPGLIDTLLPDLGGVLGLGLGRPGPRIIGRFQKILVHDDWWDSNLETDTTNNEITCTAGVWTMIGRYKVQPRQRAHFGYGSAQTPDNQGYLYIAIYDDTATNSALEEGKVRLTQVSADDLRKIVVGEWATIDLRGDKNDRNKRIALPEQVQFPWVGEDSYLAIEFKPDATDDIVKTAIGTAAGEDLWNVPVTIETKG